MVLETGGEGLGAILMPSKGGKRNGRQFSFAIPLGTQGSHEVITILAGHSDIADEKIGAGTANANERRRGVVCLYHLRPCSREEAPDQLPRIAIGIDRNLPPDAAPRLTRIPEE
jgi:hypothetical protein